MRQTTPSSTHVKRRRHRWLFVIGLVLLVLAFYPIWRAVYEIKVDMNDEAGRAASSSTAATATTAKRIEGPPRRSSLPLNVPDATSGSTSVPSARSGSQAVGDLSSATTDVPSTTSAPDATSDAPSTTSAPDTTTDVPSTTLVADTTTDVPPTTSVPDTTTDVPPTTSVPDTTTNVQTRSSEAGTDASSTTTLLPSSVTHHNENRETSMTSWRRVRFFDVFLFTYEIELIEARIAELASITEKFVLVESLVTFQGSQRLGLYTKLRERLPPDFRDKIMLHQCNDLGGGLAWDRERKARHCAQQAMRAAGIRPWDMVYFSDADEIPSSSTISHHVNEVQNLMYLDGLEGGRREVVAKLRTLFPMKLSLRHFLYNFRTEVDQWLTDLYLVFEESDATIDHVAQSPENQAMQSSSERDYIQHIIRTQQWNFSQRVSPPNAGWHCSWCFRSVEQFAEKFKSYSHVEFFDERNYSPENIKNCTCNGGWILQFRGTLHMPRRRMSFDEARAIMPQYLAHYAKEPRFRHLLPNETHCELPLSLGDKLIPGINDTHAPPPTTTTMEPTTTTVASS